MSVSRLCQRLERHTRCLGLIEKKARLQVHARQDQCGLYRLDGMSAVYVVGRYSSVGQKLGVSYEPAIMPALTNSWQARDFHCPDRQSLSVRQNVERPAVEIIPMCHCQLPAPETLPQTSRRVAFSLLRM